jgi:hypothetical protein
LDPSIPVFPTLLEFPNACAIPSVTCPSGMIHSGGLCQQNCKPATSILPGTPQLLVSGVLLDGSAAPYQVQLLDVSSPTDHVVNFDFGDGSNFSNADRCKTAYERATDFICAHPYVDHTYTTPGVYLATLTDVTSGQLIGQETITVLDPAKPVPLCPNHLPYPDRPVAYLPGTTPPMFAAPSESILVNGQSSISVKQGSPITVTWNSGGAASCRGDVQQESPYAVTRMGVYPNKSGSVTGTLSGLGSAYTWVIYTLTCYGEDEIQFAQQSATVNWTP